MSHLWAEQIRIVLHPAQVILLRLAGKRSHRIKEKCIIPCAANNSEKPTWHSAVQALETALPEFCTHKADATVVLSNHLVRYTLIKGFDQVSTAAEEQALIHHHFNRIYGDTSTQWHLSISRSEHPAWPRVACAVDRELIDSIQSIFMQSEATLFSIQPYLMAAFNQYRTRIQDSLWMALVEDGVLCLARLENKQWRRIKCSMTCNDWRHDLAIQLERENMLFGQHESNSEARTPVLVFAPEYPQPIDVTPEPQPAEDLPHHVVSMLDPSLWPEPVETTEPTQAIALIA